MGKVKESLTEVVGCRLCDVGMSTAARCTCCGVVCCLDCYLAHGCVVVVEPPAKVEPVKTDPIRVDKPDPGKPGETDDQRSSSSSDSDGLPAAV